MSESRKYTVSEIAKIRGVSERAIYKQLKSHAEELEGHIEKIQGKQWLDEYAVEVLEKAAVNSAPAVVETVKEQEVQKLRDEIERLKSELDDSRKTVDNVSNAMVDFIKKHNENAKLVAESKLYIEQRDNAEKEIVRLREECQQIKIEAESEKADAIRKAEDALKNKLQEEFNNQKSSMEQKHQEDLEAEKNRKLTIKEAFKRVICKKGE